MEMHLDDWSEKLLFGIDPIDAQHKQLFDLAATFEGNGDQIRVMRSVTLLINYVKVHFKDEEQMLEQCAYPRIDEHKLMHAQFKSLLYQLLQDAHNMTLDEIADRVQYLINGWFYNHILVADLDYVQRVKEKSVAIRG